MKSMQSFIDDEVANDNGGDNHQPGAYHLNQ